MKSRDSEEVPEPPFNRSFSQITLFSGGTIRGEAMVIAALAAIENEERRKKIVI
jgi:hypothetical protein